MKNANWLDEPITWRKSFQLSGITTAISIVWLAIIYRDDIKDAIDNIKPVFKRK